MPTSPELLERAEKYADSRKISLIRERLLGYGSDGTVWRTSRHSAVKALEQERNYLNELRCYQRLQLARIENIKQLAIPTLVDWDSDLWIVEMTLVQPPYLLDFGKVYIDSPPPYWSDAQLMANMNAEGRELFEKRWPEVLRVLASLRALGIYYVDPKPANINFGDD